MSEDDKADTLGMTATIVGAYVTNNRVSVGELAEFIATVHKALAAMGEEPQAPEATAKLAPAQIRKSVTPDFIISFEDGRRYKSMRRHLTNRGLTPETYRAKWGLPKDYPMVSPNYAAQRSELAKKLGLGRAGQGGKPQSATEPAPTAATPAPAKKAAATTHKGVTAAPNGKVARGSRKPANAVGEPDSGVTGGKPIDPATDTVS